MTQNEQSIDLIKGCKSIKVLQEVNGQTNTIQSAGRVQKSEDILIHQSLMLDSSIKLNSENNSMISIVFLAAEPTNTSRLRVGEELREIQEKLQLAKLRDEFRLEQRMSVRPVDLTQTLLDLAPKIVHFSGHGTITGALCFEDSRGEAHPISPDTLAALFKEFSSQVECVLLNACYSENQAIAISEYIDYVIGMNQAIGDNAAIAFSVGFYQALGAGRTVEEAYKFGCIQIRLQGIPEHLTPIIISRLKS
jgi:hypothetical protein